MVESECSKRVASNRVHADRSYGVRRRKESIARPAGTRRFCHIGEALCSIPFSCRPIFSSNDVTQPGMIGPRTSVHPRQAGLGNGAERGKVKQLDARCNCSPLHRSFSTVPAFDAGCQTWFEVLTAK